MREAVCASVCACFVPRCVCRVCRESARPVKTGGEALSVVLR